MGRYSIANSGGARNAAPRALATRQRPARLERIPFPEPECLSPEDLACWRRLWPRLNAESQRTQAERWRENGETQ